MTRGGDQNFFRDFLIFLSDKIYGFDLKDTPGYTPVSDNTLSIT